MRSIKQNVFLVVTAPDGRTWNVGTRNGGGFTHNGAEMAMSDLSKFVPWAIAPVAVSTTMEALAEMLAHKESLND